MEQFIQQLASGLANGAIYACVALALVMIYVSTDHINFAQGEMAMFSTYISWQLMSWGLSFWVAFILAVLISFALGVLIERVILRPLHNAPVLSVVVARDRQARNPKSQQMGEIKPYCEDKKYDPSQPTGTAQIT